MTAAAKKVLFFLSSCLENFPNLSRRENERPIFPVQEIKGVLMNVGLSFPQNGIAGLSFKCIRLNYSPHLPLWFEYTGFFVFLILLLPILWISYIWDQIIDPEYDMEPEDIPPPESSFLRWFYRSAKKINTSLGARTVIFLLVAALAVSSAVLDVVSEKLSCFTFTINHLFNFS
jgi:hypothetical protein